MAACTEKSLVPSMIGLCTIPGMSLHSVAVPQLITFNLTSCFLHRVATAAPPSTKLANIAMVTDCGKADTPCATTPWSAANTNIYGWLICASPDLVIQQA